MKKMSFIFSCLIMISTTTLAADLNCRGDFGVSGSDRQELISTSSILEEECPSYIKVKDKRSDGSFRPILKLESIEDLEGKKKECTYSDIEYTLKCVPKRF